MFSFPLALTFWVLVGHALSFPGRALTYASFVQLMRTFLGERPSPSGIASLILISIAAAAGPSTLFGNFAGTRCKVINHELLTGT